MIVGDLVEADAALAATGRPIVKPRMPGLEGAVTAYTRRLAELYDLPARALASVPIDNWIDIPPDDRVRRIARSPVDHPTRRLLADLLLQVEPPPIHTLEGLTELLRLVADVVLPVLFVSMERVTPEVGFLLALVEVAPRIPLVVWLPIEATGDLDRLADRGDRVAAVLRDGLVRLPQREAAPNPGPVPSRSSALASYPTVPLPRIAVPPNQFDSIFDSQAEALLAALLEAHPLTAGLFTPQGEPGFLMGNEQPARIDLLCKNLLIAVEIDGPHHLEPIQYRRDRYKDLELQRGGYLILRFLAEDVMASGEVVRDRILNEVLWRAGRHKDIDSV